MQLGIPAGVDTSLARRLALLTLVRLLLLGALTFLIEVYYFGELSSGGFSSVVAISTVGTAFLLSALYTLLLRRGRRIELIAYAQLLSDQLAWTVIVYLSGGVTSGSTSLYGLTCVSGAILLGTPGAVWAAVFGMLSYLATCVLFVTGALLPPADQSSSAYVLDAQQMVYPAFSTLAATALVSMLAAYLAERLRATGGRLEAATRRADEAERLAELGKLAAGLAHEIRNPLGSIRGSVELLRTGGGLGPEDQRLCEIVERETARLDDLVTDMVDLSRPRRPDKSVVDLAATAHSVVALARGSGRATDLTISYEGPAALRVRADAAQLRQVLWNLVRNAVQASGDGAEVIVTIERDGGDAILSVTDHGIGIPDSRRDHIFDAFYTTRSQGVGIGLAVVKQVVEAHGFDIEVRSAENEGTTFSVRIPERDVVSTTIPRVGGTAALLLCLAIGAGQVGCGGQEWVRGVDGEPAEGEVWWGFDVEAPPSARPSAVAPPPPRSPGEVVAGPGEKIETFRNTYYDFPAESTEPESGPTRQLFDAACKPIRTVSQVFHDQVCVQGSGRLATGETVSFAKRDCSCAAVCTRTDQKICFEKLDPAAFPFGRGANGTAITPLRSVAVDVAIIPMRSVLYIPDYHGLKGPDGKVHDGCFIAEDRGLKVVGKHIDIFTGNPTTTASWNQAVPSNQGVRVIIGASRCAHLRQE
jgi:signal transduction histidine kinase/3D (Asp-Asp-Asp) domain-containing protein